MATKHASCLNQPECDGVDRFARDIPMRRAVRIVCFDPNYTETNFIVSKLANNRQLNGSIQLFTCELLFMDDLKSASARNEWIIVVLFGAEMIEKASQFRQVRSILVVNSVNKSHLTNTDHGKTVLLFEEADSMMIQLEKTTATFERHMTQSLDGVLGTFDRKEISMRDLQHAAGASIWCHVFRTMVEVMPRSDDAQRQMLEECRSYYSNDLRALAQIQEFEDRYESSAAIRWYTKSGFLSKIINKALRTEDTVALYAFRYYIADLSASLRALRDQQSATRVYRGVIVSRNELDMYQVGYTVAANGFLSTSRARDVAERFCDYDPPETLPARTKDDEYQHILIEINIDPDHASDIVLADIATDSSFTSEDEILFDTGSTFKIDSICYDDGHQVWHIRMHTSIELVSRYRAYESYIRELLSETHVDVLFGILLTDMGEYAKALAYFDRLLQRWPNDHKEQTNIYFALSRVHRFNGENDTALRLLQQAECLQRNKLNDSVCDRIKSICDLARILAGIGSVYFEMHDFQQELHYYGHALEMYRSVLPENHIEMARSHNRLGFAYLNQNRPQDAVCSLIKALNIYRTVVPSDHPGIGQTLLNLGRAQHELGTVNLTLDLYQEALDVSEKILPADHPHLVLPCYLLALCYEQQRQFDRALTYVQRALAICEKQQASEHKLFPQIRETISRVNNQLRPE